MAAATKRHIKIELSVILTVLQLFHVGHVVQNKRSGLSLAWYEWFSGKGENERFTATGSRYRQSLNMKILLGRLADNVKKLHQKACRTCSTIIFHHLTKQIIDL